MRILSTVIVSALFLSGCSAQKEFFADLTQTSQPKVKAEEVKNPQPKNLKEEWEEKDTKIDGWTLVWHDEFSNEESLSNWNEQNWPSEKNNELQYYSPANVDIKDGHLVIESNKEKFRGRDYTSGAVTTENKFQFRYGMVEIRAKLPEGQGLFPAFWMVPSEEDWLPEINIMDFLGQNPNEYVQVVHWENENGERMRDFSHYISEEIDFTKEFHDFGLIWEPDKLTWTLDGNIVFESEVLSPDMPMYLYLNTAIGGDWPGDPDPDAEYPKEMLIDHVRVYQQQVFQQQ
ncbi:family 16 glycosylhydrolase [Bacillus sp. SG-1]|uniref:family 16 glycosylhydrolase n=1 Tax=Bacillus sp. SG-1 TaxID=161544 RepID=UPI00030A8983|nr:family 16 glycosylhydrolase [Bacillus sp. SG-1]